MTADWFLRVGKAGIKRYTDTMMGDASPIIPRSQGGLLSGSEGYKWSEKVPVSR